MRSKLYFISFVEEAVLNPKWEGYVGGRVEITGPGDDYPREEIRFLTNKLSEFYRVRDTWDFKEINAGKLEQLRKILKGMNDRIGES